MSLTSPTDNFECSDEEHERIGKKVQDVIDKFDTSTFKIDNKINFATSMCNMPVENSTHTTSTGRLLRGSTRKVTIAVKGGAVCRLCSTDNVDLNLRNDDNTFPSNAPAENTDIQNPPLNSAPSPTVTPSRQPSTSPSMSRAPSSTPSVDPSSAPSLSPWTVVVHSIEARLARDIDKVLEDSSEISCLSGASLDVSVLLTALNGPLQINCIAAAPLTKIPTKAPVNPPTKYPTKIPTKAPVKRPTKSPTKMPTKAPVMSPTKYPTKIPTKAPVKRPTKSPTKMPTKYPTKYPTKMPTKVPV